MKFRIQNLLDEELTIEQAGTEVITQTSARRRRSTSSGTFSN